MSLISAAQFNLLSGIAYSHFLTFAKEIVIVKESQQIVNNSSEPSLFGYPPEQITQEIEYIPVTGVFSGIKVGPGEPADYQLSSLQTRITNNKTYIKVLKNTSDFIEHGKTEYLIIDGLQYNIDSKVHIQDFCKYLFYRYEIKQVE